MASYKAIMNPFTGKLQYVNSDVLIKILESVDTYNNLPITGNSENDLRITKDTDDMYIWSISSSSGNLNDWTNIGSISSIDWSGITNKPSSSVSDIDDAVSKKHTQNTDTKLDEGGANEKSANELIVSYSSGNWKKIIGIQYNPITEKLKITYDE